MSHKKSLLLLSLLTVSCINGMERRNNSYRLPMLAIGLGLLAAGHENIKAVQAQLPSQLVPIKTIDDLPNRVANHTNWDWNPISGGTLHSENKCIERASSNYLTLCKECGDANNPKCLMLLGKDKLAHRVQMYITGAFLFSYIGALLTLLSMCAG